MPADEAWLDRIVRLSSPLPGVEVAPHYGSPSLKVGGKAFAGMSRYQALWTTCPIELKAALIDARPDLYFDNDHFRNGPAVLVRLETIDDDTLGARLEAAWAERAPKRLVKERDA